LDASLILLRNQDRRYRSAFRREGRRGRTSASRVLSPSRAASLPRLKGEKRKREREKGKKKGEPEARLRFRIGSISGLCLRPPKAGKSCLSGVRAGKRRERREKGGIQEGFFCAVLSVYLAFAVGEGREKKKREKKGKRDRIHDQREGTDLDFINPSSAFVLVAAGEREGVGGGKKKKKEKKERGADEARRCAFCTPASC